MLRALTAALFVSVLCFTPTVASAAPSDVVSEFDEYSTDLHLDFGAVLTAAEGEEPVRTDPFAQGSWVWHAYGGAGIGDGAGNLFSGSFGAGYYFYDNLSINFDGSFVFVDNNRDNGKDAVGGQVDFIFRWHFWKHEKWTLFADFSFGMVAYSQEFPTFGSNFNFVWQVGPGFTYELKPDLHLIGGARWCHISNGNFFDDLNPGYDGVQLWLGVMWPF